MRQILLSTLCASAIAFGGVTAASAQFATGSENRMDNRGATEQRMSPAAAQPDSMAKMKKSKMAKAKKPMARGGMSKDGMAKDGARM
jgi:pentapeptide MXKDX repeat protein